MSDDWGNSAQEDSWTTGAKDDKKNDNSSWGDSWDTPVNQSGSSSWTENTGDNQRNFSDGRGDRRGRGNTFRGNGSRGGRSDYRSDNFSRNQDGGSRTNNDSWGSSAGNSESWNVDDGGTDRRGGYRGGRGGSFRGGRGRQNDSYQSGRNGDRTNESSSWDTSTPNESSWNDEPNKGGMSSNKTSRNQESWDNDNRSSEQRNNSSGDNNNEDPEYKGPYKPAELDLEEEARLQAEGVGENFKRYNDQRVTCLPEDAIKPIERFEDVIESNLLLTNVKSLKYKEMTPIQKWAMPAIMKGYDIIGCAQTGSGKTAAFLLPILQNILKVDLAAYDPNDDCQHPYCLIISPTRELARQIYTHAEMLSKDSIIKCRVIYGQIATMHLKAQLSRGCHILVATLGRLKDFVERNWVGFKNIKYIVLDEGDRLVDEGFTADIKAIFNHESMPPSEERQTLFFSATFKKGIQSNAREYLRQSFIFLTVGRIGAANEDIKQEFLQVERHNKKRELIDILKKLPETDKAIIFTQTKVTADFLAGFFTSAGLLAASIHGDRHQYQREQAISCFRRGERRFLISSPVGNRGLDLPKVAVVINYDLPDCIDEYVHRIGRTGRAGHTGRAISFFDKDRDREIVPDLLQILKEASQEIPSWLNEDDGFSNAAGTGESNNGNAGDDDWTNCGSSAAVGDSAASASADTEDWGGSATTSAPSGIPVSSVDDDWTNVTKSTAEKRPADDDSGNPSKKPVSGGSQSQAEEWW